MTKKLDKMRNSLKSVHECYGFQSVGSPA